MSMRARIVVLIAVVAGMSGCHKQAPPATQPIPVTPPAAPVADPSSRGQSTPPNTRPVPDNTADDEGRRMVVASITAMIHFDYNAAVLLPADKAKLDAKAAILQANLDVRIRITGDCDERGSDQYNIALGMRRAMVAKEYLSLAGIDGARIEVTSLGREMPLDDSHTEAAWATNRRDEFTVTAGSIR